MEAALGIGIGLAVAFVTEAFSVGAQSMGLQAGYRFATTIDPNTQADSTVLMVFTQIGHRAALLRHGLDREIMRVFARSMETYPAGSSCLRAARRHSPARRVRRCSPPAFGWRCR